MNNLILILLMVFGGVALMVVFLDRFAKPMEPEKVARISKWIMPLVGIMLLLSAVKYLMG